MMNDAIKMHRRVHPRWKDALSLHVIGVDAERRQLVIVDHGH